MTARAIAAESAPMTRVRVAGCDLQDTERAA
jgi:hypothetical protein